MNLNGNHHHIQPDKQDAVYHFTNHPVYQNVYTQQSPVFLGHIKHTAIIGTPQLQANIQNAHVNVHNIHSSPHINQINPHTQPTIHTFQPSTHNLQPSVHNLQVSLHDTQPIPLNTQVIAHNPQVSTQEIAYTIPASQVPTINTAVSAYNTQVITHNPQIIVCNEIAAHNTEQQTTLEVIQHNITPVEIQDTEQPKCLIKVDAKTDTQEVSSDTVETNDEEQKCQVTVEVKQMPEQVSSKPEKKQKIVGKSKNSVDTSHFTIEERLIAAVWVHERKNIKKSMRQLKQDFHQRFGRKAPAKNTLLGWERKLFATGCLEDAPRTGRPVKRRNRVEEVAASIRSAPSLSLRARALALRVPTTTLHTILTRDLAVSHDTDTSKTLTKKITKKVKLTKRKLKPPGETTAAAPAPDHFPETMALC